MWCTCTLGFNVFLLLVEDHWVLKHFLAFRSKASPFYAWKAFEQSLSSSGMLRSHIINAFNSQKSSWNLCLLYASFCGYFPWSLWIMQKYFMLSSSFICYLTILFISTHQSNTHWNERRAGLTSVYTFLITWVTKQWEEKFILNFTYDLIWGWLSM